ncbi:MAG: DUF4982 domain-containing protein [Clostridiales bacterium]|jgi:beta-galactosidase|nr:DUF4982 domain-containing protein [Clostridiales bacterium]
MTILDFNDNWLCENIDGGSPKTVTLPYDAMIYEKRSEDSLGRHNIGWFEAHDYKYSKKFFVPAEHQSKNIFFEFQGVYRNAEVFINGQMAASRPYGYTSFHIFANSFLSYGLENEITVIAHNSDQPNSRWYSGTGIYRPVCMHVADSKHILLHGIKISTLSANPAVIQVLVKTSCAGEVSIAIFDQGSLAASASQLTDGETLISLNIPNAKLWDLHTPYLYVCKATFFSDQASETFGIRTVSWSDEGFCINNKRVVLRGACVHHDNGLLGACSFPEAERRKIRLLKESGYNAIRSAHNPCSKAILSACDELGMYVLDEYVDLWYIHKTKHDYADLMPNWWRQDLTDMVDKDFNHPSVVMYSTGNEVSETAQPRGIELSAQMTDFLHGLDKTRPVTCGINIFFNFLSSIGLGVYSDEKASKEPVGSEFFNSLAGIFGDKAMKLGATLYPCDLKTKDAFQTLDIAGYNYGILRYKHDLKKYHSRLILGTETFCRDAYAFWELAKSNPRLIGDFVWAGMDYLGEAGIGSWEYEDYAPKHSSKSGWLSSGSGRLNLIGRAGAEAAYTKVAFEQSAGPIIAVRPVYQKGKHSPSAWKMTNAIESWSWHGCDSESVFVEVYARAAKAELFINGKSVGTKSFKNDCRLVFQTAYKDGTVSVDIFDSNSKKTGSASLATAGPETVITIKPEQPSIHNKELLFALIQLTDSKGILKPMEKRSITLSVSGGHLLAFGSACPYTLDDFHSGLATTYYGEALAIVRADSESGVTLTALTATDGKLSAFATIPIADSKPAS